MDETTTNKLNYHMSIILLAGLLFASLPFMLGIKWFYSTLFTCFHIISLIMWLMVILLGTEALKGVKEINSYSKGIKMRVKMAILCILLLVLLYAVSPAFIVPEIIL